MKSRKNLTRFTYDTTAFQGWRLTLERKGTTFTKYFSDKKYGSERKALKAAEVALRNSGSCWITHGWWTASYPRPPSPRLRSYWRGA